MQSIGLRLRASFAALGARILGRRAIGILLDRAVERA
jgi:hypothetical protein